MLVFPDFIYKPKECDELLKPFLKALNGPVCFLVEWENGPLKVEYNPASPGHFEFIFAD